MSDITELGHDPEIRRFEFIVAVQSDDIELLTLIAMSIESYPNADHAAIATYFAAKFGLKPA